MIMFKSVLSLLFLLNLSCHGISAERLNETKNPATETGSVSVDGTQLNYVAEGKGMPFLVIGSLVYYPGTISKHLRDHFRFYFVDMRWLAKNYTPVNPEDFTLSMILDDIEKIRTALNLDKINIMGHSIHGVIAYEYAKK